MRGAGSFSRPLHGLLFIWRLIPPMNRWAIVIRRCATALSGWILDRTIVSADDPLMSLVSIQNEIEKLDPAERASLIDLLWDSLDEERIKEIEAKWAAESEDRIDAFERGELPAVDGPTALGEIRSSLTK